MLHQAWQLVYRATVVVGLLLTFVAVSEVIDLYLSLRALNPRLAVGFAIGVGLVVSVGSLYFVVALHRRPRVLDPPPRSVLEEGNPRPHVRYLSRYLDRLAANPNLSEVERTAAHSAGERVTQLARVRRTTPELIEEVRKVEQAVIEPLLGSLRQHADDEVRRSVRDVMLGVTVSVYRGADVLIVLYRSGALILRLTAIYVGRPTAREQLQVVSDVIRLVAAVNLLNLGSGLLEHLSSRLPIIGSFVDDIAQGLGAGFFTSAAGHAAIARCEAFRGWDRQEAIASVPVQARQFLSDASQSFTVDILRQLRSRMGSVVPSTESEQPGFWDRIAQGIHDATEATSREMDRYVARPTAATGRAVVATGSRLGQGVRRGWNSSMQAGEHALRRFRRAGPTGDPPAEGGKEEANERGSCSDQVTVSVGRRAAKGVQRGWVGSVHVGRRAWERLRSGSTRTEEVGNQPRWQRLSRLRRVPEPDETGAPPEIPVGAATPIPPAPRDRARWPWGKPWSRRSRTDATDPDGAQAPPHDD